MPLSNCRMISRFSGCRAKPTAPRGSFSNPHDIPVGRVITRVAPSFWAVEIGVLLVIAPAQNR